MATNHLNPRLGNIKGNVDTAAKGACRQTYSNLESATLEELFLKTPHLAQKLKSVVLAHWHPVLHSVIETKVHLGLLQFTPINHPLPC